jgi:hypothetical protein
VPQDYLTKPVILWHKCFDVLRHFKLRTLCKQAQPKTLLNSSLSNGARRIFSTGIRIAICRAEARASEEKVHSDELAAQERLGAPSLSAKLAGCQMFLPDIFARCI